MLSFVEFKRKKQTHVKHKIIEKSMMPTFEQNPLDETNYGNQYMDYLQKICYHKMVKRFTKVNLKKRN